MVDGQTAKPIPKKIRKIVFFFKMVKLPSAEVTSNRLSVILGMFFFFKKKTDIIKALLRKPFL